MDVDGRKSWTFELDGQASGNQVGGIVSIFPEWLDQMDQHREERIVKMTTRTPKPVTRIWISSFLLSISGASEPMATYAGVRCSGDHDSDVNIVGR